MIKRYRFCGKERDEESGLYYYGARYYACWSCRFVSIDPLAGEYPFYTPYQYAGNHPINAADLDGLEPEPGKTPSTQKAGSTGGYANGDYGVFPKSMPGPKAIDVTSLGSQPSGSAYKPETRTQQEIDKHNRGAEAQLGFEKHVNWYQNTSPVLAGEVGGPGLHPNFYMMQDIALDVLASEVLVSKLLFGGKRLLSAGSTAKIGLGTGSQMGAGLGKGSKLGTGLSKGSRLADATDDIIHLGPSVGSRAPIDSPDQPKSPKTEPPTINIALSEGKTMMANFVLAGKGIPYTQWIDEGLIGPEFGPLHIPENARAALLEIISNVPNVHFNFNRSMSNGLIMNRALANGEKVGSGLLQWEYQKMMIIYMRNPSKVSWWEHKGGTNFVPSDLERRPIF